MVTLSASFRSFAERAMGPSERRSASVDGVRAN